MITTRFGLERKRKRSIISFEEEKLEWLRDQYKFHKKELLLLCGLNRDNLSAEANSDLDEIIRLVKEQMQVVVLEGNKRKKFLTGLG